MQHLVKLCWPWLSCSSRFRLVHVHHKSQPISLFVLLIGKSGRAWKLVYATLLTASSKVHEQTWRQLCVCPCRGKAMRSKKIHIQKKSCSTKKKETLLMLDKLSEIILCGPVKERRGLILQLKGPYNTYLEHLPHHFKSN